MESWTASEGFSGEHIWGITRDPHGDLWVTTNNGVNQLRATDSDRNAWRAWTEKDGLGGNQTRAITVGPDGAVSVGSSPGGVSRIDPRSGQIRRYNLPGVPGSDRIWYLTFDRAGTLWVCTRGGLFLLERQGGRYGSFKRQELPMGSDSETISSALEDRVAVSGSQACTDSRAGKTGFGDASRRRTMPTNAVGFVAEAPDGAIWLGYRDRTGLSRIDVQGDHLSVSTYNGRSGLHSDQAIFVKVDRRGWVWFGTDRGIEVLRDGQWRHYGQQNGLIWDDCDTGAFHEDQDGSVWIGTSRGLAHFRPPVVERKSAGPHVEFSRFQLGGRLLDPTANIVEPYRNRSLAAQCLCSHFARKAM